jgi:hypothetical protein
MSTSQTRHSKTSRLFDAAFDDFEQRMALVDKDLEEIIDYTEKTTGLSTHSLRNHDKQQRQKNGGRISCQYINIARKPSNLHSEVSSLTTMDSIRLTESVSNESSMTLETIMSEDSESWKVTTEQKQVVLVDSNFGKNVARIANQQYRVRFVGDEEVCLIDIGTITQALQTLMDERNEFIKETLDLMQATKAAANLASDVADFDEVEC